MLSGLCHLSIPIALSPANRAVTWRYVFHLRIALRPAEIGALAMVRWRLDSGAAQPRRKVVA